MVGFEYWYFWGKEKYANVQEMLLTIFFRNLIFLGTMLLFWKVYVENEKLIATSFSPDLPHSTMFTANLMRMKSYVVGAFVVLLVMLTLQILELKAGYYCYMFLAMYILIL
jgi:hypothetical protein